VDRKAETFDAGADRESRNPEREQRTGEQSENGEKNSGQRRGAVTGAGASA
jgi:hypothetical protein